MPRKGSITAVRYSMICDIISPDNSTPTDTQVSGGEGHWEWKQDVESGNIVQEWVRDDPNTVGVEGIVIKDVPCFAEGILDGGIRVAGSTETFKEDYEATDWVRAQFPKDVMITRRDRIANIRNKMTGEVMWREEEVYGRPDTVFNIMGVTPVHFLGTLVEQHALLERTEVQGG